MFFIDYVNSIIQNLNTKCNKIDISRSQFLVFYAQEFDYVAVTNLYIEKAHGQYHSQHYFRFSY